ncbi:L-aspartate oxidase [Corynebacterium sp.]|uniref:L-aspartate oxidase n=1 Tax=Corynebacterium sp. TaxID=1720 RepID=UPI002A912ACD|nr:FAD-binding protein [Corynebacterium sp.]MDY5784611.1 FAD-binding protein [Corynebacterium sp.]
MRHVIVVGCGVAGMSAALAAANSADVTLVYPGRDIATSPGSTQLAQGGIAAAIAPSDSPDAHARDTVAAGAGLVDAHAATYLTHNGAQAVARLLREGFPADPGAGLEAAHSAARVVHAGGDRTGAVLHDYLARRIAEHPRIAYAPGSTVTELTLRDGCVAGVNGLSGDAVILATGGYCGVYPRSTGASGALGTGIVAAARAGADLADMEFVQFHPTVLEGTGVLISEAVRGAGATLHDDTGTRFLTSIDPRAELAPRDVVAAGIEHARQSSRVWLDARHIDDLARRFPGITASLRAAGIDWTQQRVPVAPAAHYSMGGICTDAAGRTTVPGLYAVGEVARTGVHGANRLASNSLLEAMVYGQAAGEESSSDAPWAGPTAARDVLEVELPASREDGAHTGAAREAIGRGVGIERTAAGIEACRDTLAELSGDAAATGTLMCAAALARTESRGAHRRVDFPHTDPAQARSIVLRAADSPDYTLDHSKGRPC